jgi:hypothetical protein
LALACSRAEEVPFYHCRSFLKTKFGKQPEIGQCICENGACAQFNISGTWAQAETVMAKKTSLQIVTANHLLEGHSIFLSEHGWTADHHAARIAATAEEAAALETLGRADEDANQVVGVYLVAVDFDADGKPEPTHYREKMRVRAVPSFWPDPVKSRTQALKSKAEGEAIHVSL